MDGIIVGTYVQNEELGKKASWTRKAVLITDGQNSLEIEEDDIEATLAKLNEWNVDLTLVSVFLFLKLPSSNSSSVVVLISMISTSHMKNPTSQI